jgi:phage FluMu protein Com
MSITITLEAQRMKCPNCDELLDLGEVTLLPAYECGECGVIDDERRCPDCNKFKAKADGGLCPECNEHVDDPDGYMVPVITCGCHDEEHVVNV